MRAALRHFAIPVLLYWGVDQEAKNSQALYLYTWDLVRETNSATSSNEIGDILPLLMKRFQR